MPFWREKGEWESPREMTDSEVDRILTFEPFSRIDPARFSAAVPYRGVLQNDACLRRVRRGEIVVRSGDYGNSAFYICSGSVQVALDALDPSLIGRRQPQRRNLWEALGQLWRQPRYPEVRPQFVADPRLRIEESDDGTKIFLQDVSGLVGPRGVAVLGRGEFFGEIAALGRTPRTSTIVAAEDSELLEIRWQGLRELRLRSPELKEHIDRLYRERSLNAHLRETPIFRNLSEADLERVAAATEFQTYGTFDWHGSYKKLADLSPAERLQMEPVVAQQGDYANGVYLVRSGFARLSETYNHGERTVSYLGRGQMFGFEEAAHNSRAAEARPYQRTLRAVGYVDVLFVPAAVIRELVLPALPAGAVPGPDRRPASAAEDADPELLEFLVEKRFINGTAAMVINLERCTRCDDCVRACAATHGNNPRFRREGAAHGWFMIAHACMHCQDPVCMIGCPTGAIHRHQAGGQVTINDSTCIGCSTCANSCPYENIRMVPVRDADGLVVRDQGAGQPIQKATKCDLCAEQLTGPACANACPHDALARVDMREPERLADWLSR